MPKKVDITKLQEQAARAVYQKNFQSSFKDEIQRAARRQGEQLARKLTKEPGFQRKMETLMRNWIKENMDVLVKEAMKDAHLTW